MFQNNRSMTRVIFLLLTLALSLPLLSSEGAAEEVNKLLIIDVSGSMRARIDNMKKIDIAKKVICEYVKTLPATDNVGVIAYGHRRKSDCTDVEYLVPLGINNRQEIISKVKALKAQGKTPIAKSLRKAVEIIENKPGKKVIILVSDGRESCKAKPCDLITQYKNEGKQFINHVIGFDVDRRATKQLECIADAGGGTYYPVNNFSGFQMAFQNVQKDQAPVDVTPQADNDEPTLTRLTTGRLSVPKSTYIAGERIWLEFSTTDKYDDSAWIGIIPSDVPHGKEKLNDKHDIKYKYMKGKQKGYFEFFAPGKPGRYDFRMNDTDNNGVEVASVTFTVVKGSATMQLSKTNLISGEPFTVKFNTKVQLAKRAWMGIIPSEIPHGDEGRNDAHDISYKYLNGEKSGERKFVAPPKPGSYDMRLHDTDDNGTEIASITFTVSGSTGSVSINKKEFHTAEEIIVSFSTPTKLNNRAWVGIVPSDIPHGSESRNDRFDVAYKYLNGETSGIRTFYAPTKPGTYDFRLNDSDNNGNEIASVSFRVSKAAGTISIPKKRYNPGQIIWVTVTTSRKLTKRAWVGIIPSEIPHGDENRNDQHDISYQYLNGKIKSIKEFKAPSKPGRYDLRLNDSDSNGNELTYTTFTVSN